MLSIPDLAVVSALALIFFGPDQLPKVARKVGHVMRDVQNTSQSFIREIERAADDHPVERTNGYADVAQSYPEYHYDESAYHADYATGGPMAPPADMTPVDVTPAPAAHESTVAPAHRPAAYSPGDENVFRAEHAPKS